MSVGTWGFGTGATGTGSHPFCLRVQGVDYIGSVPIESIAVNASVSSNATLTFTIVDPTGTMPVPQGWADVEFLDTTEQEWIFGGLVIGVESTLGAPPIVEHRVRCVDYGILLDVTPVMADFTTGPIWTADVVQQIAGQCPLGGVMALKYDGTGPGRLADYVVEGDTPRYVIPALSVAAETISRGSSARSAVDTYAGRSENSEAFTSTPGEVYVTPLRQLAFQPLGKAFGSAPLEVRQNPTTASHVAAAEISYDSDHRSAESGVYVSDTDTTTGGDNSDWYTGTINGYTVMPANISRALPSDTIAALEARIYIDGKATTASGQATVACAKNFQPGQALTVYYPGLGLDGTYSITAVSTRFLGGTSLMRQSTVQFNGERGTVARFNRTRFARAGVTT